MSSGYLESVLIIPPEGMKVEAAISKERLVDFLEQRFPEHSFDLVTEAPFECGDRYIALPMVLEGAALPRDIADLLPARERLAIEDACAEFELASVH